MTSTTKVALAAAQKVAATAKQALDRFTQKAKSLRAKEAKDKHMMRGECIECKVSRKFTTLPLPKARRCGLSR